MNFLNENLINFGRVQTLITLIPEMKKLLFLFVCSFLTVISFGQNKVEKEASAIVYEGKMLYYSEMASWYGTDIFLEKCSSQRVNAGGYF